MKVQLYGFDADPPRAVAAVRALRDVTRMGLKEAKLDYYDVVRDGATVVIRDIDAAGLEVLKAGGWKGVIMDMDERDENIHVCLILPDNMVDIFVTMAHNCGGKVTNHG